MLYNLSLNANDMPQSTEVIVTKVGASDYRMPRWKYLLRASRTPNLKAECCGGCISGSDGLAGSSVCVQVNSCCKET